MQGDYEKLKKEESEKSNKLQELMSVNNKSVYTNNHHANNVINDNINNTRNSSNLLTQSAALITNSTTIPYYSSPPSSPKIESNHFISSESIATTPVKTQKNLLNSLKQHSFYHNSSTLNVKSSSSSPSSPTTHIKTLQLHIIISITMFLITHKCPHFLLVI